MPPTFHRDRFTWLAYLLLAFYGYYINVLGPITPFLKNELGLTYTVSSLHYTAFALGILLVGLGGNLVTARLGRWRSLWVAAFGLSLGTLLLLLGKTPVITIGASLLMGLVGSLTLIIVSSALSDQHGELRAVALSEANVIASLVASAAPLMVGGFAGLPGGWRLALGLVALTPLVLYSLFRRTRPAEIPPAPETANHPVRGLPPLYWVYWLGIVLAVAAEFCMISWSADYFETVLGLSKPQAAQAVSLFFIAMILGRLAGSRLVQRIAPHRLVPAATLVALAGFLLYWRAEGSAQGMLGLFVTGLGIASIYPLVLSLALGAAGTQTVQASTRTTLASGIAILTLPLLLGRLADAAGIREAYSVVLLLLTSLLVIILLTGIKTGGLTAQPAQSSSD